MYNEILLLLCVVMCDIDNIIIINNVCVCVYYVCVCVLMKCINVY